MAWAKRWSWVVAAMALLHIPAAHARPVRIGVAADHGREACLQRWRATADYLTGRIGRPCRILPLLPRELETHLAGQELDFMILSAPLHCVLQQRFGGEPIATLVSNPLGRALAQTGSAVIVRTDSPIRELADIRGRRFMCVRRRSFDGYQTARRLMLQHGIDPQRDCFFFKEGGSDARVIDLVLQGAIEVGVVRAGTIEWMVSRGRCRREDLRVIDAQEDGFPFAHSTPLYPNWPFVACDWTEPDLRERVARALREMPRHNPAAREAECAGWREPLDYGEVRDCLWDVGMIRASDWEIAEREW